MTKHKEQILEELGKKFGEFLVSIDKKTGVMNHHNIEKCKKFFTKALSKSQQATIEEVEKAFEEYKKWLAEQHKIESGAGDAVDLTANAMRMAQIERGANNVRDFILDKLKKEG